MLKFGRSIPVIIHPIFWLVVGLISWLNAQTFWGTIIWIAVILFSLLVHEYGHALMAKGFGQNAQIELVAMGGLTYHDGKQLKKWQDFLVVLLGPLSSILLAGAAYLLKLSIGAMHPLVMYILTVVIFINIFWTVINLLPIMPLDGGQMLRIVLEGIFGPKGLKFSLVFGVIVSISLGVVAFIVGYFLVGAIMLLLAFESFSSWNQIKNMTAEDRNQDNQKALEEAQSELHSGQLESAKEKLNSVREKTKKGLLFDAASEQLAFIYEKEGQIEKVYETLKCASLNLSTQGKCLLHRAAFYAKDYALTAKIGNRCFQESQSYEVAFLNAMASAQLNDVRAAIGWLQSAVKNGLPSIEDAAKKPEFDPVRDHPQFKAFMNWD